MNAAAPTWAIRRARGILAEEVSDRGLPLDLAARAAASIEPLLAVRRAEWAPPRDPWTGLCYAVAVAQRRLENYILRTGAQAAMHAVCAELSRRGAPLTTQETPVGTHP